MGQTVILWNNNILLGENHMTHKETTKWVNDNLNAESAEVLQIFVDYLKMDCISVKGIWKEKVFYFVVL